MGFNPFRPARKSVADLALVVATIVVIIGLLSWAIWG